VPPLRATSLDAGGYHVLHAGTATAVLRYPRFYFRPNQADVLHADLWSGDRNILRDAGTYSYNAPINTYEYFAGTRGHNTVMFDGREQMPRVSRYLFGHWLKAEDVLLATEQEGAWHAAAAYVDHAGARHHRKISLSTSTFTCVDQLSGTAKTAVLRWRLEPGLWQQQGSTFSKDGIEISIISDQAPRRLELVEGEESRHYLEKTAVPVLEAEFTVPARISTHVTF
jgi:Heparinase II/III-like protein